MAKRALPIATPRQSSPTRKVRIFGRGGIRASDEPAVQNVSLPSVAALLDRTTMLASSGQARVRFGAFPFRFWVE
jgi:hypothetical protein